MNNNAATLMAAGVHLWRGERHVLRGVSFTLQSGELLHLRGANGAGKTSLLRVLCGLLPPEEGKVTWNGGDVRVSGAGFPEALSYLGHDNALKGDLTVIENLRFEIGLRRPVKRAHLDAVLARFGLADCAALPCRVLSAGQRRRAALCRVLLSGAQLWILDEPFTNLDAESTGQFSTALAAHLEQGGLAVLAAHQGLGIPERGVKVWELK